jgi:hypothetical protein
MFRAPGPGTASVELLGRPASLPQQLDVRARDKRSDQIT